MEEATGFPFRDPDPTQSPSIQLPILPISLRHGGKALEAPGLLDTGSTVNVLPYPLGLQLGAIWNPRDQALELTGNLARYEARPLVVTAQVAAYPPVRLAFAWTKAEQVPVILGQVNFFLEFEVCIFGSQGRFEVRPRRG